MVKFMRNKPEVKARPFLIYSSISKHPEVAVKFNTTRMN